MIDGESRLSQTVKVLITRLSQLFYIIFLSLNFTRYCKSLIGVYL